MPWKLSPTWPRHHLEWVPPSPLRSPAIPQPSPRLAGTWLINIWGIYGIPSLFCTFDWVKYCRMMLDFRIWGYPIQSTSWVKEDCSNTFKNYQQLAFPRAQYPPRHAKNILRCHPCGFRSFAIGYKLLATTFNAF